MNIRQHLVRRLALALPTLTLLVGVVVANLWALDHPQRWDLTSAGVYSIGPQTKRVLAELKQPVSITFFYDLRSKEMGDARALLEQYAARNPLLKVQTFDPAIAPAEARRLQVQFAGTAVIESASRRVVVNGGSEADFTNGLIRATAQGDQTICFTEGHLEADPNSLSTHDHFEGDMGSGHSHSSGGRALVVHERHGMGMARQALETLGFGVRGVSLVAGPDGLRGCSVVVIAAPQQAFMAAEVDQLSTWSLQGGRLIALVDPFTDSGLDPLFAAFGLRLDHRLVLDDKSHYWTDPATPAVSSYPRHKMTRNLPLTFYPGAAPLAPLPVKGLDVRLTPLVQTSDSARAEPIALAPRPGLRPVAAAAASAATASAKVDSGLQTLAVHAVRNLGGEQRAELLLVGDGDFASNSFFHVLGNGTFFLNGVSVLAEQDRLIDITPRNYELPRVQLTNTQMRATFLISTVLLPLAALLAALAAWWRRRR